MPRIEVEIVGTKEQQTNIHRTRDKARDKNRQLYIDRQRVPKSDKWQMTKDKQSLGEGLRDAYVCALDIYIERLTSPKS